MPQSIKIPISFGVVLFVLSARYIGEAQDIHNADTAVPATQRFTLADTKDLVVEPGVKAEAVEYRGRKAVRLTRDAIDQSSMALINGTDFQDGTIEVDIATKVTTPPGGRRPGFSGIAFRVGPDASHYELFYLRPGNAKAEDQAMRNHSVQYSSAPGFGWEKLRRQWPFIYESWADLELDEWTKVKIDVHGRQAKLYVNGSDKPSLVVDGLKGEQLQGAIGLWGYTGEEAYFSNLRIGNAKPEPIANGGEGAGTWEVTCGTDAGGFPGTLKLVRQDSSLVGIWSGGLGLDQAVDGTWRDGYVELSFAGTWPGQPGTVTATLAGWIDGDSAGGRMKVEGRADGRWTAIRKK